MGNSPTRVSEEDIKFIQEQTSFSREEIEKWYKNFIKECPTGKLSKLEFQKVYAKLFPRNNPRVFCEHVFRSFDADGNGFIEFREFLVAINICSKDTNPIAKLNWAFSFYDIDGNGQIDEEEMAKIISAIHHLLGKDSDQTTETPEMWTKAIFQRVDTNKDGVISKEEFVNGCMENPLLKQLLISGATPSN